MNKYLSDTRLVLALAALVIVCATVLVGLNRVPFADAIKVLSGFFGGLLAAWMRGTPAPAAEPAKAPTTPPLPLLALALVLMLGFTGCADVKPVLRTANDVAQAMCSLFYSKQKGLSVDDAAKTFCSTQKQLQPWIDHVLATEQSGVAGLEPTELDAGTDGE
jgi:hypothetical protein